MGSMSRCRSLMLALCLGLFAPGLSAAEAAPQSASDPYRWSSVAIGGGGFVTGLCFHPTEPGLAYARTDVGGAYRWDAKENTWVALLDSLSPSDSNLTGVESLALDPSDPERVYLALGTYTHPDAPKGAIFRSRDRGANWERTDLPFRLGANEAGRGVGERLVVDPNLGSRLWYGSRREGLWLSEDGGGSWKRQDSFPEFRDNSDGQTLRGTDGRFNYLAQAVGIQWILPVSSSGRSGEPTPVWIAAVADKRSPLFWSRDGGASWAALPGQPQGLLAARAALSRDVALVVPYADEPGPNRMAKGAVWRFALDTQVWSDITPAQAIASSPRCGFAAVAVDPSNPQRLLVSTWSREPADELYLSEDAGQSWRPLLADAAWDHSSAPYSKQSSPHWICDVKIDPFDPGHARFTTGYGLWGTRTLGGTSGDTRTRWFFDNRGLEETVPLVLVSPPEGARLLSGLGDIDGFVHTDFSESPKHGRFSAPGFKNTEWIDFAGSNSLFLVRSGTTYHDDRILGAWSEDGGWHWQAFASQPEHPPGYPLRHGTGAVAVSADAKTLVWSIHGLCPAWTADRGESWVFSKGVPAGVQVASDRVDPRLFYAVDPHEGRLYVSEDAGRSFVLRSDKLPKLQRRYWTPRVELKPEPGKQGALWLAMDGILFRSPDAGHTLLPVETVERARALGFGKGSSAGQASLFLIGRIQGKDGVFRSDDASSSWLRISDDHHRFPTAHLITGDARHFGAVYLGTGGRGIVYGHPVGSVSTEAAEGSKLSK